jgi:hypothetical protein
MKYPLGLRWVCINKSRAILIVGTRLRWTDVQKFRATLIVGDRFRWPGVNALYLSYSPMTVGS